MSALDPAALPEAIPFRVRLIAAIARYWAMVAASDPVTAMEAAISKGEGSLVREGVLMHAEQAGGFSSVGLSQMSDEEILEEIRHRRRVREDLRYYGPEGYAKLREKNARRFLRELGISMKKVRGCPADDPSFRLFDDKTTKNIVYKKAAFDLEQVESFLADGAKLRRILRGAKS